MQALPIPEVVDIVAGVLSALSTRILLAGSPRYQARQRHADFKGEVRSWTSVLPVQSPILRQQ